MSKKQEKSGRVAVGEDVLPLHGISPCLYIPGMRELLLNEKIYCSSAKLHKCMDRGIINEADIIVFRVIYKFRCVTRHTLSDAIFYDDQILSEYKRASYKSVLNKLSKLGLLKRRTFQYERNGKLCSTPCFYTLSYTAREYIYRMDVRPGEFCFIPYPEKTSIVEMLKNAIFLQFHTRFIKENADIIKQSYTYFEVNHKNRHCTIYGLYRFYKKEEDEKKENDSIMDMVVLPLRKNPECISRLSHDLCIIEEYMKKQKQGFHMPVYVFLCESSSHAKEIHNWMNKSSYSSIPYFFLIDQNLMEDNLFGKMFSFEKDAAGNDVLSLHQFKLKEQPEEEKQEEAIE